MPTSPPPTQSHPSPPPLTPTCESHLPCCCPSRTGPGCWQTADSWRWTGETSSEPHSAHSWSGEGLDHGAPLCTDSTAWPSPPGHWMSLRLCQQWWWLWRWSHQQWLSLHSVAARNSTWWWCLLKRCACSLQLLPSFPPPLRSSEDAGERREQSSLLTE